MVPRLMPPPPEVVADGSQNSKARKGRRGKTDKGKGKAAKGAGKRRLPTKYNLTKEQEDHYVDWLRENEAIWRRGHHNYHKRHAIWAAYGAEVGLDPLELEAWFINKRDVCTKTKRLVSASGSGAAALASLSDNQAWVLKRFTFYD
ncbi:MAG: hypothetical protein GY707_19080 [Desulfobacteraceae bacterium]|nr:hypothetical protein [Desulfobacteraceae bacterium]